MLLSDQTRNRFFKWFYPGMGVKRWISLGLFGLFLVVSVALYAVRILSKSNVLLASFSTALLIFGVFLVVTSMQNILNLFVRALMPRQDEELVDLVYQKRQERALEKGQHVVVIGGGTGLSTILQGIKKYTKNITAIVTVTDNGGSSGRLRDEMDVLPPGDIRNCLVALADAQPLMLDLFQYRFEDGSGLKGHSFGNLFITALSKITGDFDRAIKESSKVLAIRGSVIPATLENVSLVGYFEDGTTAEGETNITDVNKPIDRICLSPETCKATGEALDAIENADIIIYGPGSLFTSILPNLLIKDLLQKILESDGRKYYISNVMTQPGETNHFSVYDHFRELIKHTDPRLVDTVIVNNGIISEEMLRKYNDKGAIPVEMDCQKIRDLGYGVIEADIVSQEGQVRHDHDKLAQLIFSGTDSELREKERVAAGSSARGK